MTSDFNRATDSPMPTECKADASVVLTVLSSLGANVGGGRTLRLPGIAILAFCTLAACDREQRPVAHLGQLTCADLRQVVEDERDAATMAAVTQTAEVGGGLGLGGAALAQAIPVWGPLAYVAVVGTLKLFGFLDGNPTAHDAEARTAETVMWVKQVADLCDVQVADAGPADG